MTRETALVHEQEVRRQAMLQAMQVDVWLPRQPLLNAAASQAYLLDWQTVDEVSVRPVPAAQPAARPSVAVAAKRPQPSAAEARTPGSAGYVSVRDKLALAAVKPTAKASGAMAALEHSDAALAVSVPVDQVQAEPIPRFALQILRADQCLLLVDLPTGEPFQSRDPDFQLLKDMLRAAGLSPQPQFLRQGTPLVWPILRSGNLMATQHAGAARACVRDLLSVELQHAPSRCIWLLGQHAVRFGNAAEDTPLYSLQPFTEAVQVWSLPSLESVLEQPLIKRDIWQSMRAVRSLWQVKNDTES